MNNMIDSLFCECGGKYQHIDQEQGDDGVIDTYQCNCCETWCYIRWDAETQPDIEIWIQEHIAEDSEDEE